MSVEGVPIQINDLLKVCRPVVGLTADEAEYQNILLLPVDEEVIVLDPSGAAEGRNLFVRVVVTGEEGYIPRYCVDASLPVPVSSDGERDSLLLPDKVTSEAPTPDAAFSSHVPDQSASVNPLFVPPPPNSDPPPLQGERVELRSLELTTGEGTWNPSGRVSTVMASQVQSNKAKPSGKTTVLMQQYKHLDWESRRPHIRAKRKGNMQGCFGVFSGICGDLWPSALLETPFVTIGFFLLILANFAFTIGAVMTDSLTQAQISGVVVNTTKASELLSVSDESLTLEMALNRTQTGDDILANISYNIQCGWKSAVVTYEEFDPYTKDNTRIDKDTLRPNSKRIQYGKKEDLCQRYWNASDLGSDDGGRVVFCFDMSEDDSEMVQSEGTVWLYALFVSVPALFLSFCFISTEAGPCIFVVSILIGLSSQMIAFINWDSNPAAKDCWQHVSLLEYSSDMDSSQSSTVNALYMDVSDDWSFIGLSQMMVIVTMTILCIACCMLCSANTSAREKWKDQSWTYGRGKKQRNQWADAHVFDPFVDAFDLVCCTPTTQSDGVCLNCGIHFDASWFICLFVCCLVCDDDCEICDCEGGC